MYWKQKIRILVKAPSPPLQWRRRCTNLNVKNPCYCSYLCKKLFGSLHNYWFILQSGYWRVSCYCGIIQTYCFVCGSLNRTKRITLTLRSHVKVFCFGFSINFHYISESFLLFSASKFHFGNKSCLKYFFLSWLP